MPKSLAYVTLATTDRYAWLLFRRLHSRTVMLGLVEQIQKVLLRFLGGSVAGTSSEGGLSPGLPRR